MTNDFGTGRLDLNVVWNLWDTDRSAGGTLLKGNHEGHGLLGVLVHLIRVDLLRLVELLLGRLLLRVRRLLLLGLAQQLPELQRLKNSLRKLNQTRRRLTQGRRRNWLLATQNRNNESWKPTEIPLNLKSSKLKES